MAPWKPTQRRCPHCGTPLLAKWCREGFRKQAAVYVCRDCDLTPGTAPDPEIFTGRDPRTDTIT